MNKFNKWISKHTILATLILTVFITIFVAACFIPVQTYKGTRCTDESARYSIVLGQAGSFFDDKDRSEKAIKRWTSMLAAGGCPMVDDYGRLYLF